MLENKNIANTQKLFIKIDQKTSIFFQILYLGANIYLPALALNTLTPISLTWTIASTSAVCIIYTTLVSSYIRVART